MNTQFGGCDCAAGKVVCDCVNHKLVAEVNAEYETLAVRDDYDEADDISDVGPQAHSVAVYRRHRWHRVGNPSLGGVMSLIDRLRGGVYGLNRIALCAEAADKIERLTAENEALRADAERYRWLKHNPQWLGWEHDFRPDEVEREIDAAMEA